MSGEAALVVWRGTLFQVLVVEDGKLSVDEHTLLLVQPVGCTSSLLLGTPCLDLHLDFEVSFVSHVSMLEGKKILLGPRRGKEVGIKRLVVGLMDLGMVR